MKHLLLILVVVALNLLQSGCAKTDAPSPPGTQAAAADGKYLLPEEPAGAQGVIAAKKEAKDGQDVVVVGRIGGSAKPWVEGRATFWIVDPSFKPCNETEDDACPTPWDYCCDDPDALRKGMATVKVVDDRGQAVPTDARQLLRLKELQTVVVRGQAKRDEQGNLTILASDLYVRPDAAKK